MNKNEFAREIVRRIGNNVSYNETEGYLSFCSALMLSIPIPVDGLYEIYNGVVTDDVVNSIVSTLDEMKYIIDFNKVKNNLRVKVIEFDLEKVSNMAYERVMNLALVAYVDFKYFCAYVTMQSLKMWGLSLSEVMSIAKENTFKMDNVFFKTMEEVLGGMGVACSDNDTNMYILTNKDKFLGAAYIASEDILKFVYSKIKSNFWVIPSSIHELIIVKDKEEVDSSTLLDMVIEVNATVVDSVDFLSNSIYYYNGNKIELRGEVCNESKI